MTSQTASLGVKKKVSALSHLASRSPSNELRLEPLEEEVGRMSLGELGTGGWWHLQSCTRTSQHRPYRRLTAFTDSNDSIRRD